VLGGLMGWLVNTVASAIVGLIVGAVIVAVMSVTFHRRKSHGTAKDESETESTPATETTAQTPKGTDSPK